ncbi:MAG: cystathionine gamma-synthase family protein [Pseudomonadales bacterium]|nr:cystathionine gamma-synthase family protein [Pseudomonadales bacterium]MBO6594303.1 cystathionine gamma-synthase family protein [Pseudomonadales bacterium]MBO6700804.1 cystathionine gamma-synthase family protein [Pseudomonadales bacterium]MBO6822136.1 cystathionine gamma-synthase family protein [Pseudomonadales bacterium]MBO7004876.1 cystathionine gamma-synthase family protein [Pseudomonadales bacterium]
MATKSRGFTSTIVHTDRRDPIEHGSIHKPVHTAVTYSYDDARDLAAVFQGEKGGYTYGRQVNPTVTALQDKISMMENSLSTAAFGTGMAAIGTTLFALLRAGDHFISSSFLFGNTNSLFNSFAAHGIEVTFVDATSREEVEKAVQPNTKLVFVETIANPRTQVSDLEGIGEVCREHGLIYFVDNTMTTPYLFQPREVGASLIINSLTKYIGGHANALGGSVTETGNYDWSDFPNIYDNYKKGDPSGWAIQQIKKKGLRDFGASLGPEAAHHISVGSDTLALRMERICSNAQTLCEYLSNHSKVKKVYYPGVADHPEHERSSTLFRHHGGIFSIELVDDVDCFDFINKLDLVICSSNLGDTRSLAIPVAHSIYFEMGPERRASMGIDDSLVRFSMGIEEPDDLVTDFEQALGI